MSNREKLMTRIEPWDVLSSEIVLQDRWITVRADTCKNSRGNVIAPYYVVEPPDWVHVLAFDSNMDVLVLYQYRHGAKQICTEIVAGTVDPNESPHVTAERELLEETGCKASRIDYVGPYRPNPANQSNTLHCYVAYDLEKIAEPSFDESEHIEYEFIPLEELAELIDRGDFAEALFIHSLVVGLRHAGLSLPPRR